MSDLDTERRAIAVLQQAGIPVDPYRVIEVLSEAGLSLADAQRKEMVCRWVPTGERAVPPDADTIIRTITTTNAQASWSNVYWLDGLRPPM